MEELTWMPMFWGDYLKDTTHLSTAEHGAYLLLIAHYWVTRAPLPDDDERLRRIARMDKSEWRKARDAVMAFFTNGDEGWHQKRIDAELEKWSLLRGARKEKAEKAAEARWAKQRACSKHAPSIAPTVLEDCPSPSPISKEANAPLESGRRTAPVAKAPPPSPEQSRGSRLPDAWMPTPDAAAWAASEHPDIDAAAETEKFRDYWRAKAGKDARKADWLATWRNWIRNARADARPRASPQPDLMAAIDRVCGVQSRQAPRDMGPVIEVEATPWEP